MLVNLLVLNIIHYLDSNEVDFSSHLEFVTGSNCNSIDFRFNYIILDTDIQNIIIKQCNQIYNIKY